MGPVNDATRQRRADLVRTIEQALSGLDESLATEIDAVNTLWQSKYDRLMADLMAKEKAHDETRRELSSKISRLEATLARGEAKRQARDESGEVAGRADRADGSVAELRQSLEKSRQRYESVRGQLDSVVKVAQTRKEQIVGWIKYADSLEAKIERLEKRRNRPHAVAAAAASAAAASAAAAAGSTRATTPSMPPTPVTMEKPRPLHIHTEVEKPTISASFSSSSSSFLGLGLGFTASFDDDAVVVAAAAAPQGTSSEEPDLPVRVSAADANGQSVQTGQSNDAALESTQGDPSSDGSPPELSELAELPELSRLSKLSTPRVADPTATKERQTHVKEEPSSDSPEVMWERPVKRARTDNRSAAPHTPMVLPDSRREQDAPKSTPLASIAHHRESQESIDLDEGQLLVPTPRKRQLYLEQMASERECGGSSDSVHQPSPTPGPPPPARASPNPNPNPKALAPVSVNVRRGTMDPATRMKSLKRGIESVAEDNEGYTTPDGTPRRTAMEPPPSTGNTGNTSKASRLNSLLNSRPAGSSPVISATSVTGRRSPSRRQNQRASCDSPLPWSLGQPPPPRLLPHLRDGTVNSLTAALNAAKAESAAKKATPPLRGKTLDQLKMDDFKINPAMNNGDTFAYNEVVRGRTDRAGLAGCTDAQCCGKVFRSMATSELDAAGQAHVDRPAGITLMERHLGNEAGKLAGMGSDEKRELWIVARTKELADKYGKHRHRYHRRASPPGFWDTDFPTTQEEEYNRAEAEKVARLTVQERYREAMKPSGRWLFRDE